MRYSQQFDTFWYHSYPFPGVYLRTTAEIATLAQEQRKHLGWSQATLAEKVGVSRKWIGDFESGKPTLALGLVLRTLHELGIHLWFEREGEDQEVIDLDRILEDEP